MTTNHLSRERARPTGVRPESFKKNLTGRQKLARLAFVGLAVMGAKDVAVGTEHVVAHGAESVSDFFGLENKYSEIHAPDLKKPHREYVVHTSQADAENGNYMTETSVAHEAYPDKDPRDVIPMIKKELGRSTLQQGDVIEFPADAHIGVLIDPAHTK